MKPSNGTVIGHEGNFAPEQSQIMSFDMDSLPFLMSILTDMYSDTELAPIREYSTNAFDSHKAAGNPQPIEIELPTSLKPMFIVRDFGVGMSVDEITNNYSKYGASSKRDTNDEVGILGIGCKSGLTYTNQFSLVAVKNGVRTSVQITRNDNGVGVLHVLDTRATDLPDGVEVSIPVKNPPAFSRKAENFFRFWEKGTVLVNGRAIESVFEGKTDGFLTLDPDIIVTKELNTHYVVMGNIAYPVDMDAGIGYDYHVVARVDIGSVDFTPSRESLHLTPKTKEVVKAIALFVKDRVGFHIQNELDAAPTHWDALKVAQTWKRVSSSNQRYYKGEKLPTYGIPIGGYRWACNYGYKTPARKTESIGLEDLVHPNTILLFDHPRRSMDIHTKEKIKAAHPNVNMVYVVTYVHDDNVAWMDGATKISFDDYRPPKLPRKPRGKNRLDTSTWWIRSPRSSVFVQDDTPVVGDICYIGRNESKGGWNSLTRESLRNAVANLLNNAVPDTTLALLGSTDVKRFQKQYPHAKHFSDHIRTAFTVIEAQLTDEQIAWGLENHELAEFDPDNILDPNVKDLIRRMNDCKDARPLLTRRKYIVDQFPRLVTVADLHSREESCKSVIPSMITQWAKDYPLILDRYGSIKGTDDQKIEYINALYTYRKGTK